MRKPCLEEHWNAHRQLCLISCMNAMSRTGARVYRQIKLRHGSAKSAAACTHSLLHQRIAQVSALHHVRESEAGQQVSPARQSSGVLGSFLVWPFALLLPGHAGPPFHETLEALFLKRDPPGRLGPLPGSWGESHVHLLSGLVK